MGDKSPKNTQKQKQLQQKKKEDQKKKPAQPATKNKLLVILWGGRRPICPWALAVQCASSFAGNP